MEESRELRRPSDRSGEIIAGWAGKLGVVGGAMGLKPRYSVLASAGGDLAAGNFEGALTKGFAAAFSAFVFK